MADDLEQVKAEIDATGEIEDAMLDAARRLHDEHDYTYDDLVTLLEGIFEDA